MDKMIRKFELDHSLNWDNGIEISKMKKDIEELEKMGATHIDMGVDYEYGHPYFEIKVLSNRLETDEEYKKRIKDQNEKLEIIKKRELAQLEKLKKKYDNLKQNSNG